MIYFLFKIIQNRLLNNSLILAKNNFVDFSSVPLKVCYMQIKDLNNVPINESGSQNPQDERKENYIFWTKSNQPISDEFPNGKWIWIVGPNYEKKSDKPPDLRNLGGFYSDDDVNNPAGV